MPAAKCDRTSTVCLCVHASRRVQCFKVSYAKRNYITGVSGSLSDYNIDFAASELFRPTFDNASTM
jgi:hypothetical protein